MLLEAPWYQNYSQRLYLPLRHADFFMAHGNQPVEVRANFLADDEMQQLWKNYDFTFQPTVPVDRSKMARL